MVLEKEHDAISLVEVPSFIACIGGDWREPCLLAALSL